MSTEVLIDRALTIPAPDLDALVQGRLIAIIPKVQIERGWSFILCPGGTSINPLPVESQYRSNCLDVAQSALNQLKATTVEIKTWARCEFCTLLFEPKNLDALSYLTGWTPLALIKALEQRQHLFLTCLRVYQLSEPIKIPVKCFDIEKLGKFVGLGTLDLPSNLTVPLSVSTALPVLNDLVFNQRKQRLSNFELSPHPELEGLQMEIAKTVGIEGEGLSDLIQTFLGWTSKKLVQGIKRELEWIYTIDALGNRSKEVDEGQNNHQAGTKFENIVRDSLQFLGFSVDKSHKGGPGGIDIFCSKPYPLVGECKSGKKIPNATAVQLLNLGTLRLKDKETFSQAAKLIIGPGEPTDQLKEAAKVHGMAIINPMSLQRLVELQAKHPGSVDLIELKQYLEPGQIDHKIDEYVNQVLAKIHLRVHIVQTIKKYLDAVGVLDANIDTLFGVYSGSNPSQIVSPQEFREILIELSSPLTGYLGRRKGEDGSDRFYFLRDMEELSNLES